METIFANIFIVFVYAIFAICFFATVLEIKNSVQLKLALSREGSTVLQDNLTSGLIINPLGMLHFSAYIWKRKYKAEQSNKVRKIADKVFWYTLISSSSIVLFVLALLSIFVILKA